MNGYDEKKSLFRKVVCLTITMLMLASALLMCACSKNESADSAGEAVETEDKVRAADPMTEEEIEADDTDGCIEDSEDLLY